MKVQLWKILVLPAVDDQTIGRELKFVYQALNGGIEICEKNGIGRIKFFQGDDSFLWQEQNMKWIGRLRMVKRHQCLCFAQSFNGNGKAHVLKNPADQTRDRGLP